MLKVFVRYSSIFVIFVLTFILLRALHRNRTNRIYIDIQNVVYYKELAHVVMEAENSHDLTSVTWRPEKPGSAVLVQIWRSENQESQCVNSSMSPKAREPGALMANGKRDECASSRRENEFALLLPFCSFQAFNSLNDVHPHWWRWMSLFSLLIWMLIFSRNILTDTPRYVLHAI